MENTTQTKEMSNFEKIVACQQRSIDEFCVLKDQLSMFTDEEINNIPIPYNPNSDVAFTQANAARLVSYMIASSGKEKKYEPRFMYAGKVFNDPYLKSNCYTEDENGKRQYQKYDFIPIISTDFKTKEAKVLQLVHAKQVTTKGNRGSILDYDIRLDFKEQNSFHQMLKNIRDYVDVNKLHYNKDSNKIKTCVDAICYNAWKNDVNALKGITPEVQECYDVKQDRINAIMNFDDNKYFNDKDNVVNRFFHYAKKSMTESNGKNDYMLDTVESLVRLGNKPDEIIPLLDNYAPNAPLANYKAAKDSSRKKYGQYIVDTVYNDQCTTHDLHEIYESKKEANNQYEKKSKSKAFAR